MAREKFFKVASAFNHHERKDILNILKANGQTDVTTIYEKLKLKQAVVSHHLGVLRKADIVTVTRKGAFRLYDINYPVYNKMLEFVDFLEKK